MLVSTSSVALLLFTRPAAQEAISKPLCSSKGRNTRIRQAMEMLIWNKILATKLPAFLSYRLPGQEPEQPPGEQFRRAAQTVLEQSFNTVICVNCDYPSLRVTDLQAAAQLAAPEQPMQSTLPMGIDQRGGIYLLGLNAAVLRDTQAFDSLPWRTPQLAQALAEHMHEQEQWVARLSATYRNWATNADVCLDEAVGEPASLQTLASLLKHVQGQESTTQLLSRACPPSSGLRTPI